MLFTRLSIQKLLFLLLLAIFVRPCPDDQNCLACVKAFGSYQCIACQNSLAVNGKCEEVTGESSAGHALRSWTRIRPPASA